MGSYRENIISNLQSAMREQGLSMLALSKKAGVKYDIVRDLIRGKTQMTSAENLDKLKTALGMASLHTPIGIPYHMETERSIPAYDSIRIAAGAAKVLSDNTPPEKTIHYRTSRPNLRAIKVEGRSMDKVAVPGQYAIVDFDITDPRELNGKLVIACVADACTFKRLHIDPTGRISLLPESTLPDYDIITVTEYADFRIIGKVIDVVSDRSNFE